MENFICSHIRSPWSRKRSQMPTVSAEEQRESRESRESPTERMPSRCWTTEEHRAARTLQRILFLERDPISLRPIRRRFLLLRGELLLAFDAFEFAAYVIATGDIRDPITRQPLTTHEHLRLARLSEGRRSRRCRSCGSNTRSGWSDRLSRLSSTTILLHTQRHQEYATDLVDILSSDAERSPRRPRCRDAISRIEGISSLW